MASLLSILLLLLAFTSSFQSGLAESRKELRKKETNQETVIQLRHSVHSNRIDPSRVVPLSWQPRVFLYKHFLSEEECDHLINLAHGMKENGLSNDDNSGHVVPDRLLTSSEVSLNIEDDAVSRIEERISAWTFLPKDNSRPLQVMHYGLEEVEKNFDYFVILYLSNVTRGGEIFFPESEMKSKIWSDCNKSSNILRPVKGNAILFFTLQPNASPDKSSSHARCPILEGEMWYATKFFHIRSVRGGKVSMETDSTDCTDEHDNCPKWAAIGECQRNSVPVKSVTEFHKLYASSVCGSCKSVKKIATELPRRNHRGLIVHLVSPSKNADVCLVGKMNFVDLAGYEDARRKSVDVLNLVESTKINKSIYAIHNNFNDHLLGNGFEFYCMSPVINLAVTDTTRKAKSSPRPMVVPSSHKKNRLPGSVPSTVKKHTASQVHFSEKKTNCISSALKGRKLFVKASHQTTSEKASSLPNIVSTVESLEQGKENCILNVNNVTVLSEVENPLVVALKDTESTSVLEKEASPLPTSTAVKTTIPNKDVFLASEVSLHGGDHHEQDTSYVNGSTALSFAEEEGHSIDKENQLMLANERVSPPISERLRELSNNLKLLCYSTSSHVKLLEENETSSFGQSTEIVEPKTPIMEQTMRVNDRCEVADVYSPWETLSTRSFGMK
ncbi:kinesin-like protein KIN-10C isoform X2, partial [Fagus crenata]